MRARTIALAATPVVVIAAVVVGLSFVGEDAETADAAAPAPPAAEDTRLADAHQQCVKSSTAITTLTIADNGQTLLVDTNPNDIESGRYSATSYTDAFVCVLGKLGTPAAIVSKIERTNSLMGAQEASHDELNYSWTFHPDHGTELIITRDAVS